MNQTVLPPLRHKPYGGAWSIHDPESVSIIDSIKPTQGDTKEFLHDYSQWFRAGKDLQGIGKFSNVDFSAGTTDTFYMFYFRHLDRRLRLFKDEYFVHHMIARNYFKDHMVIDQAPLQKGDVVVMSCPFSNTGTLPDNFYSILAKCDQLKIPVMLDLAYINISNISDLNLEYDCIQTITTSLSKVFPVENFRIGIRFEKQLYDDPMVALNQNNYLNLHSVNIGHTLIKKFSNSWLFEKYREKQLSYCEKLGLEASDCVIFGLAQKGKFDEYNRGGSKTRLCFSRVWDERITL